jgi:glyoxylase-like metal-dependent hydrolase (beta-lactamase superfamily II)
MMETLWGEFLPTPVTKLFTPQDGDIIEIEGLRFTALDTPGHANHHFAYIFEGVCFSGDIGGVRLSGTSHLRLPMPPPEFHLENWRKSLKRLKNEFKRDAIQKIAPTHFGIYHDPGWHLNMLNKALDDVEAWMCQVMPSEPSIEQLRDQFVEWVRQQAINAGIATLIIDTYESANPSWMSAYGIQRYWRKYRQTQEI